MRKTLLIYYLFFGCYTGGIELFLVRLVEALKKENDNNRIIAICDKKLHFANEYKDLMNSIDVVYLNNVYEFMNCEEICFSENEEVLALTFYLLPFMQIEQLKKKYPKTKIHNIFWVPHFEPSYVFLEMEKSFPKFFKNYMYNKIRNIIIELDKNNNIYYLHNRHLEAFENHYKYSVVNPDIKVNHCISKEIPPFNSEIVKNRYNNKYNILSICRFEFPHKGYILGLVDAYAKLKDKYPELTLTLIGDGVNRDLLYKKVNGLPEYMKRDIEMPGIVIGSNLEPYFKKAFVNVSVAGGLTDGAVQGIVSIQGRLYSNTCECYGFFNGSNFIEKRLSVEVGEDIIPYLEKLFTCSEEEYLRLCNNSYLAVKEQFPKSDPTEIMKFENIDPMKSVNNSDMFFFKMYYYYKLLYYSVFRRIKNLLRIFFKGRKNNADK